MSKLSYKNIYKPAPRWFRLTRLIVSWVVNLIILIMLALGYDEDGVILALTKVIQSAVADLFESLLAEIEKTPVEIIEETNHVQSI